MFNDLLKTAAEYLDLGNTEKATELLNKAHSMAFSERERVLAHDLGNAIQREIFNQYIERSEVV